MDPDRDRRSSQARSSLQPGGQKGKPNTRPEATRDGDAEADRQGHVGGPPGQSGNSLRDPRICRAATEGFRKPDKPDKNQGGEERPATPAAGARSLQIQPAEAQLFFCVWTSLLTQLRKMEDPK